MRHSYGMMSLFSFAHDMNSNRMGRLLKWPVIFHSNWINGIMWMCFGFDEIRIGRNICATMLSIRQFWWKKQAVGEDSYNKWKVLEEKNSSFLIRHSKVFLEQLEVELTENKQISINSIAKSNEKHKIFALDQKPSRRKKPATNYCEMMTTIKSQLERW